MLSFFLAKRLFFHFGTTKRVSRPAIQIATAGVAVGIVVMIISVCVALGFQTEIRNKMYGLGAHIQVLNRESLYRSESVPIQIDEALLKRLSAVEGVRHVQRFCLKTGMLKTEDSFCGVVFRGVGQEYDCNFLAQYLVEGTLPSFSDSASSQQILLPRKLANQLRVKTGDRLFAYFIEKSVRARRFYVSGIYQTNLSELDEKLVFTDLYTVHQLTGWDTPQQSGAEVLVSDHRLLDEVSEQIQSCVNHTTDDYGQTYSSPTLPQIYPAMFSWLSLLDMNVWVILVLMICVAGFTMVSGLLIIILERTNFIGVMKALGADNELMQNTFLHFASFIVLRGMFFGNVIAFLLIFLQRYTGWVHLDPENYYVDSVPVLIDWGYVLLINVCTFLLSLLALILPSMLVSRIHPATSIRFE